MKVYLMTKAKPFHPEVYLGEKGSLKEAEKALRTVSPYMRKLESVAHKKNVRTYAADKSYSLLYFIYEEEI